MTPVPPPPSGTTAGPTAEQRRAQHIAALRRERAGYEQRQLPERVAQVDAQLAHLGYDGPVDGPDPAGGPRARRTRPAETAGAGG
jgi:hypothetical protein